MVEGGTLLRCYTSQRGIEGSNPSSSALESVYFQAKLGSETKGWEKSWPFLHQPLHQRGSEGPLSRQGGLHRGSGLVPHAGHDVAVAIQSHCHRRVAQQLLHELGMVAAREQQGGACVAQIVELSAPEGPHVVIMALWETVYAELSKRASENTPSTHSGE